MECINHKDRDAVAVCTICGAPVCAECACTLNDAKVCPNCLQTACIQNVKNLDVDSTIQFGYSLLATLFYIAGIIVMSVLGKNSTGYYFLGLLLMGLPNLISFFNRRVGFVATIRGWIFMGIIQVLLGIIFTPIIVVRSLIYGIRFGKQKKYWENLLNQVTNYINSLH